MGFGEKLRKALQKMKARLIVYALAIIVGIFALVAPISRAITDANIAAKAGTDWFETFFLKLGYLTKIGENITSVFSKTYWPAFWTGTKFFILFALIFIF